MSMMMSAQQWPERREALEGEGGERGRRELMLLMARLVSIKCTLPFCQGHGCCVCLYSVVFCASECS
eukprot:2384470-Rhodomonas_salina.2